MCKNVLGDISIGDFVTAYRTGYWQLIDIKPKIAFDDYNGEGVQWKKGDNIGHWAILKKAFTDKMKPRIYFSCEDSQWIKPVSKEALSQIKKYFEEHPDYKQKFDSEEVKVPPDIMNIWIDLPEKDEADFKRLLATLPEKYTYDSLFNTIGRYKHYITKPPAKYLLNLLFFLWDVDNNGNLLFSDWNLIKDRS